MDQPQRLHQMIVTQAVRLAEAPGPLDDGAAMRSALHEGADPATRILARGWQLGLRLKYVQQLARLRAMVPVAAAVLMLAVAIGGLSVAGAVTADRHINIMLAIVTLLGTNLLMLALWLAATILVLAGKRLPGQWSFGRLLLSLAGRLVRTRSSGEMIIHAAIDVLQRARLAPWAFGLVSHALWVLIFVVVLAAMGLAFSFRAYEIGWETTILPPGFFATFVQLAGAVPHWFGFPLPEVAAPGAAAAAVDQRTWAWWLIGIVTVYGLVPRVLLALLCWLLWRHGQTRLQPDLRDPYYARLAERFDEMQGHLAADAAAPGVTAVAVQRTAFAVIGFEFHPADTRLDAVFPGPDPRVAQLAGTLEERRTVLERLAQSRPERLLVAVDACATPDRGTERFLREAYSYAARGALLLAGPPQHETPQHETQQHDRQCGERWRAWLAGTALASVACFASAGEAADWVRAADA